MSDHRDLVLVGAMAAIFLTVPLIRAEEFVHISCEIETLSHHSKNPNGEPIEKTRTFPVKCIIQRNEWRIEVDFLSNAKEIFYFDGTNVYKRTQITKDLPESNEPGPFGSPAPTGDTNIWITISPGPCPLEHMGINVPWFAYCSGSYLKQPGRVIPLPISLGRHSRDCFGYVDITETFDDDLGLPKNSRLFTSREQLKASLSDRRVRLGKAQREPTDVLVRAKDGLLKCEYSVEAATNFLGWSFPLKFVLTQYQLNEKGETELEYRAVGKTLAIQQVPQPEGVFVVGRASRIIDFRFQDGEGLLDSIHYAWTNAYVPSTSDKALQLTFRQELSHVRI